MIILLLIIIAAAVIPAIILQGLTEKPAERVDNTHVGCISAKEYTDMCDWVKSEILRADNAEAELASLRKDLQVANDALHNLDTYTVALEHEIDTLSNAYRETIAALSSAIALSLTIANRLKNKRDGTSKSICQEIDAFSTLNAPLVSEKDVSEDVEE